MSTPFSFLGLSTLFLSVSVHSLALPFSSVNDSTTLAGRPPPMYPSSPREVDWPVTCLRPTPYSLHKTLCSRAINSMSRTPGFHKAQLFTPSPNPFSGGPYKHANRLPYQWSSYADDSGPRNAVRGCSVTLTFVNWERDTRELADASTLESVQWGARRILALCAGDEELMPVGITRRGILGRLLVVVEKGDVLRGEEWTRLGNANTTAKELGIDQI